VQTAWPFCGLICGEKEQIHPELSVVLPPTPLACLSAPSPAFFTHVNPISEAKLSTLSTDCKQKIVVQHAFYHVVWFLLIQ